MLSLEPLTQTIALIIALIILNVLTYKFGRKLGEKKAKDIATFIRAVARVLEGECTIGAEIADEIAWYLENNVLDINALKDDVKKVVEKHAGKKTKD